MKLEFVELNASSAKLFHGSPKLFDVFEEREPLTRLYAHWTTNDPLLAALYAGPDGWVTPISPAENTKILDASGWPGVRPFHALSANEIETLEILVNDIGLDNGDDDVFGETHRNLRFSLNPAFGGSGILPDFVSWEGIVQEDDHDNELLNELLRSFGYSAVLCVDPLPGILGDIKHRTPEMISDEFSRYQKSAMNEIQKRGKQPVAMGFLDSSAAIVHTRAAIPASRILRLPAGHPQRTETPFNELKTLCSNDCNNIVKTNWRENGHKP